MFILHLFVFIFGSLIGSFLNVVIYRMPREESIVFPRSKCPKCKALIPWYFNIPVFGFLLTKTQCFNCKEKISIRYPLIEAFCAMIAVLLFPEHLTSKELIFFFIDFSIFCALLAHFLIDIEHQILPDKINLYLLLIIAPMQIILTPMNFWLVGGLIGFLGPLFVTWLFYKLRGVVGLGGGDIKLFGIIGILLGPFGVVSNIFMSCMLGSLVGLTLIILKKMDKNKPMPFGPYIILVLLAQYFLPEYFALINPFSFK